ncbi:MAG: prolipoprotein diacylglyceryl transferase [Phycisphaerae bacterium]|nr:prolipoprotein diacylglyceryl transferase [Phycisphaerae bacterium]
MHPELFKIPLIPLTIKSYGLMMVVGFLAAVAIIRYLSRHFTRDPQIITNAALYALVAGVVGARAFFVLHYFDRYRADPLSVFAIWNGGLEVIGGVMLAIAVILLYGRHHKVPIRHYLDVLAIGLLAALMFGRIGCFLNGCCYGRPTDLPSGMRFPYGSFSYSSQVKPDPGRHRLEPYFTLPQEYFSHTTEDGVDSSELKPAKYLTPEQRELVTKGPYRALPVHPTQLYSSAAAGLLALLLYGFWRRSQRAEASGRYGVLTKPGSIFGLMFILYAIKRFSVEMIRDDNPFEMAGLTISQLLCFVLAALGIALAIYFGLSKPEKLPSPKSK